MNPRGSKAEKKIHLSECVKLNVGGHLFQTTLATLVSHDGMLKSMFESNLEIKKDPDGFVFIDRDGEYFSEILNFLRRGSISFSRAKKELESILAEAQFYQIEQLICMLKEKLSVEEKDSSDGQNIIIITRSFEERKEFLKKSKPVLCLDLCVSHEYERYEFEKKHLLEISKKYSDVFQFILNLYNSIDGYIFWTLFYDGKELDITKAMLSSPPIYTMLDIVAQNVRSCQSKRSQPC